MYRINILNNNVKLAVEKVNVSKRHFTKHTWAFPLSWYHAPLFCRATKVAWREEYMEQRGT